MYEGYKRFGKVLEERKIYWMFGNDDFGFMGFVLEVTCASRSKIVPNTFARLFEMNGHVEAFITLPDGIKTKRNIRHSYG